MLHELCITLIEVLSLGLKCYCKVYYAGRQTRLSVHNSFWSRVRPEEDCGVPLFFK